MALATISLTSVKNYAADLSKDTFDSLKFVSLDGGELATVSGSSIYNIILGNDETADSLTYRISAAEDNILTLNNKLGDGFSDTATVTQQFSLAKERITTAEENAQNAASTLDNFLSVTDGKDFLFLLDDLMVPIGRLDKLTDGSYLCYGKKITSWDIPLPTLMNASYMFDRCKALMSFTSNLPALTNGGSMFQDCTKLTSFTGDLPALTDGYHMFLNCTSLTSFTSELPALMSATSMFYICTTLTSFTSNLPALTNGTGMFNGCTSLTSFTSNLPALTIGENMFNLCKLDLASVQNIAEGINDLAAQSKTGKITIGMAAELNGNADLTTALATIRNKGWTVTEQYNA